MMANRLLDTDTQQETTAGRKGRADPKEEIGVRPRVRKLGSDSMLFT